MNWLNSLSTIMERLSKSAWQTLLANKEISVGYIFFYWKVLGTFTVFFLECQKATHRRNFIWECLPMCYITFKTELYTYFYLGRMGAIVHYSCIIIFFFFSSFTKKVPTIKKKYVIWWTAWINWFYLWHSPQPIRTKGVSELEVEGRKPKHDSWAALRERNHHSQTWGWS